ncbi:MAG: hypothetical protein KGN01_07465 [Patescibacteria group bacterium]|nr:hypothetical protein [Patescibacteria group bacterium]
MEKTEEIVVLKLSDGAKKAWLTKFNSYGDSIAEQVRLALLMAYQASGETLPEDAEVSFLANV